MSDTTVSDPTRDDDERERTRASPPDRHHDAVDDDAVGPTADAAERTSVETDGGTSSSHATTEQSESGNDGRASFEFGIGKVDGPINLHDIYLHVRGQSLLHVLLVLLLAIGLVLVGYRLLTVGL